MLGVEMMKARWLCLLSTLGITLYWRQRGPIAHAALAPGPVQPSPLGVRQLCWGAGPADAPPGGMHAQEVLLLFSAMARFTPHVSPALKGRGASLSASLYACTRGAAQPCQALHPSNPACQKRCNLPLFFAPKEAPHSVPPSPSCASLSPEIVDFQILSEDYSKAVFLCADRTVNFHAKFGGYYRTRVPKVGASASAPASSNLAICQPAPT